MASKVSSGLLKDLTLENVALQKTKDLGQGSYGKVFAAEYLGLPCAAKEFHSILLDRADIKEMEKLREDFKRECYHSSLIRHPNIILFMGVYYEQSEIPIMVMELMDTCITKFVEKNQSNISMETKLSILYDVSLGLRYLHGRRPAVIHRDLSSNNVLLSIDHLVAKISDLGTVKMIKADSQQTRNRLTSMPGTLHFMPPEVDEINPHYGPPIDVFSFAAVGLHLFSEEWPEPTRSKILDPTTRRMIALSEAERRNRYMREMTVEASSLKELTVKCLDDEPKERPPIEKVFQKIKSLKETPPFAKALQNDRYHIEWRPFSDLPTPMYDAYVAVSNGTIYCTGTCLEKCNEHEVYCSTKSNEWEKLPRSGHRLGVIHIVDGKLTIFGGRDSTTNDIHKKVTTYNSKENSWGSCYPDMLHNRYKPGVITSHDHVIVMGGASSPDTDLDSIEAMNYRDEVPQWKEVSLHLPFPMWNIKPTVSDDNITIVGYSDDVGRDKGYFQIPVEQKISSLEPVVMKWKKMSSPAHFNTVTVPYSNPPIIIGGNDKTYSTTSDVSLYDASKASWIKVGSLTSPRKKMGVSMINSNAIIVVGGCTEGGTIKAAGESSLATVEIGNIVPNN